MPVRASASRGSAFVAARVWGRAELSARLAGAQHVVALEQAVDFDAAAGEQTKYESAMRDRFVAGRADAPAKRSGASRCQGGGGFGVHEDARFLGPRRVACGARTVDFGASVDRLDIAD